MLCEISRGGIVAYCSDLIVEQEEKEQVYFLAVAGYQTAVKAILANLVFAPISGKLKTRSAQEVLIWELTREGVLAISAGDNPRMVEQRLNAFLAPKLRQVEGE